MSNVAKHPLRAEGVTGYTHSEYGGSEAMRRGQHTHGRRNDRRFDDAYQLDRIKNHIDNPLDGITVRLARAVRKNNMGQVAVLTDLMARSKATAQVLANRISERQSQPVEHIGQGRVLLDLSAVNNRPTSARKQRWGRETLNHKRVFILEE